jgi:hypothetical protein
VILGNTGQIESRKRSAPVRLLLGKEKLTGMNRRPVFSDLDPNLFESMARDALLLIRTGL